MHEPRGAVVRGSVGEAAIEMAKRLAVLRQPRYRCAPLRLDSPATRVKRLSEWLYLNAVRYLGCQKGRSCGRSTPWPSMWAAN